MIPATSQIQTSSPRAPKLHVSVDIVQCMPDLLTCRGIDAAQPAFPHAAACERALPGLLAQARRSIPAAVVLGRCRYAIEDPRRRLRGAPRHAPTVDPRSQQDGGER